MRAAKNHRHIYTAYFIPEFTARLLIEGLDDYIIAKQANLGTRHDHTATNRAIEG